MKQHIVCASVVLVGLVGCGDDTTETPEPYVPPAGFVTNQRIVYNDGLHNENTEMLALEDRILLIFRGGETGQIGSDLAHINVYSSTDGGASFEKLSEVSAGSLPGMRDIRDPKLVRMGDKIYLYAISRVPGGHYRDLGGEAWTVRAESSDQGKTWTDPEKTFSDVDESGKETFWGFWRFTKRTFHEGGSEKEKLYALGYDDGDTQVGMFASDDGINWSKESIVVSSYADVPSESELQFFGDDQKTAVAIVRMDNQGILQDGQSAICTSQAPFSSWECGRRIEQRLDGPTWLSTGIGGVRRNFVVARKHLPCTFKRTAVYELKGDLADPGATISVCEIQELESAGDTAYTALAPLGGERWLASWYSSTIPAEGDIAWLEGIYTPADIWLADIDFSKASATECHPPPEKVACKAPALPEGDASNANNGSFLLAIAPVIYPAQTLSFEATVTAHGSSVDLSLQPLDAMTKEPVGDAWVATGVPVSEGGGFTASLDVESLPEPAFPLLSDPFLTLHALEFSGVFTSEKSFCGNLSGVAQVVGASAADAIDLGGSTFGAVRIDGSDLPSPVASCR